MHDGIERRQWLMVAMAPFVALGLLNHWYREPLYRLHVAWFWVSDVIQFVVAPAVGAWLLVGRARLGLRDVGLHWPHRTAAGLFGLLFSALVIFLFYWPLEIIAWRLGSHLADPSVLHLAMPSGHGARWLVALYAAGTAALVEEVVFRALPWLYLRGRVPARWLAPVYVIATTLLFAAVHSEQGPAGMFGAGWLGWLAARAYAKRQELWPLVLAHFAIDVACFMP